MAAVTTSPSVGARRRRTKRWLAVLLLPGLAGVPPAGRAAPPSAAAPAPDTIPVVARPPYLVPTIDPTFGTIVTRITNDSGQPTTPVAGVWGADARHVYTDQQPWNADQSLLLVQNRDGGSPSILVLDGSTYEPKFTPCDSAALFDYRWHPSRQHAHELINVTADGLTLSWFDVVTCTLTRSWTLPIAVNYGIGSGSGNVSAGGRFVALGNERGMFVVDMDPQPPFAPYPAPRIGPVYAFPPCSLLVDSPANCAIGTLSITPSGRYLDLKYSGGNDTTTDLHRIFDLDSTTLALTPHPMADASLRCGSFAARPNGWVFPLKHSDVASDPFDHDEDVIVGGRSCPGSNIGRVVKVRLRDGQVTALTDPLNEAAVSHISTRNLDRPGWAYVSYFRAPGKELNDEIVAVKLDGSGTLEHYVHYHGLTPGCYRCEAHPVPSPDGGRILFASNWALDCGDSCGDPSEIKDFVVQAGPPPPPPPPRPPRFALERIYPNPTTSVPAVVYTLEDGAAARIEMVDLLGRVVLRRDLTGEGPGQHQLLLDRSRTPPGVYWLRLFEAGREAQAKVVLLR